MRHTFPRPTEHGFSLIELLIVVAIIGIIAALAIPNLMHSRQAASSASAVSSLRLIHSSQTSYRTSQGRYATLAVLGGQYFINDHALRAGNKSSYAFTVVPDPATPDIAYTALATPSSSATINVWRHYYIDASGVIRWKPAAPAGPNDPPISN